MSEPTEPTVSPEEENAPASEALREARAQAAAKKRTKTVVVAAAAGIGSAALAAAFLYANRGKKKADQ